MRMPMRWFSFVAALVLAPSLLGACRASGDKPQRAFLPEMFESVPYDAYDERPSSPSGVPLELRLPPEGTVPIGHFSDPYAPTEADAIRAGEELVNPEAPSEEALTRGRHVFETMCLVCHGPEGEGDGPIIGRFPNPASLLAEHARSYSDGRIYHVISHGQGLMPSHAVQVLPADRWRVVLYVRALQAAAAPTAPPAAAVSGTEGGVP